MHAHSVLAIISAFDVNAQELTASSEHMEGAKLLMDGLIENVHVIGFAELIKELVQKFNLDIHDVPLREMVLAGFKKHAINAHVITVPDALDMLAVTFELSAAEIEPMIKEAVHTQLQNGGMSNEQIVSFEDLAFKPEAGAAIQLAAMWQNARNRDRLRDREVQ